MDKLELIKITHVIDHHLGKISDGVTDEALKRRIASVHAEWRELAYATTAHLCGVQSLMAGPVRRKPSRKRPEIADPQMHEEPNRAASEHADLETPGERSMDLGKETV